MDSRVKDLIKLENYFNTEILYDPTIEAYRIKIDENNCVTIPLEQITTDSMREIKKHIDNVKHEQAQQNFYGEPKATENDDLCRKIDLRDYGAKAVNGKVVIETAATKPIGTEALEAGLDALKKLTDYEDTADIYKKIYTGDWGQTTASDIAAMAANATVKVSGITGTTADTTEITTGTTDGTAEVVTKAEPWADPLATSGTAESSAAGTIMVGNPSPQSFDPLRARVEAAGSYVRPMDIAVGRYAASESKAAGTYIKPSALGTGWKPELTAAAKAKVSQAVLKNIYGIKDISGVGSAQAHTSPRAAEYTGRIDGQLIYEAIKLLTEKNKLIFNDISIMMPDENCITAKYNVIMDNGNTKDITINLFRRIFLRAEHTIDKYAGLKQTLSDRAYVILRIAYVLFRATKVDTSKATEVSNSLCRIINVSETYHSNWFYNNTFPY